MANYGLSKPLIAQLNVANGTYSNGFQCGKAVGTDITPNYSEASQYGDDTLQEYVKEFKDADVNLNVTTLPLEAASVMFGHTVDTDDKNIVFNSEDAANYVGYGFYTKEMVGGVKTVVACFIPKVKFTEAAESYVTKGDSIEFKTPTLSGKAAPDSTGKWKEKQTFATEELALAWLQGKLNITAESTTPSEPEGTGEGTGTP